LANFVEMLYVYLKILQPWCKSEISDVIDKMSEFTLSDDDMMMDDNEVLWVTKQIFFGIVINLL